MKKLLCIVLALAVSACTKPLPPAASPQTPVAQPQPQRTLTTPTPAQPQPQPQTETPVAKTETPKPEKKREVITGNAFVAFWSNAARAEAAYEGKVAEVFGMVRGIAKAPRGYPGKFIVTVYDPTAPGQALTECMTTNTEGLQKVLVESHLVTLRGTIHRWEPTLPLLKVKDCEVVKIEQRGGKVVWQKKD